MARYSREQRERAVELYERYGHSAADVIRELGYPSRGVCGRIKLFGGGGDVLLDSGVLVL